MKPAIAKHLRFKTISLMAFIACTALLAWAMRRIAFQDTEVLWRSERLRDTSPHVREDALIELASFITTPEQAETLRPMLLRLVRDPNPDVRLRALGLLTNLSRAKLLSPETLAESRAMVKFAIKDRDPFVRAAAVRCYIDLGAFTQADEILLKPLLDEDHEAVRLAVYAVLIESALPSNRRSAWLLRALNDPSEEIRQAQIAYLQITLRSGRSQLFEPPIIAVLGQMLREESKLAEPALTIVGTLRHRHPELEADLIKALDVPNPNIALGAAELLTGSANGKDAARLVVLRLIESGDEHVSSVAGARLVALGAGPEVAPLLWRIHVRWRMPNGGGAPAHSPRARLDWASIWTQALLELAPQSPEARPVIAGLIGELDDPLTRPGAASVLGAARRHAAPALPALRGWLDKLEKLQPGRPGRVAWDDQGYAVLHDVVRTIETDLAAD